MRDAWRRHAGASVSPQIDLDKRARGLAFPLADVVRHYAAVATRSATMLRYPWPRRIVTKSRSAETKCLLPPADPQVVRPAQLMR